MNKEQPMKCPESIEELEELQEMLPLCRKTLFEQAQARMKTGAGMSEREAAKELAKELEVKPDTVRKAIQREKNARVETVSPPPQCNTRPPKPVEEIVSEEFKSAYNGMLREIKNAKGVNWKTTSKKAALQYVEILKDVITI